MAYYNADATATKKLGTGYVFQGVFYPLGVDGSNKGKTVGPTAVLYQTVTVTISIKDAVKTAESVTDDKGVVWDMESILEQANAKTFKVTAARTDRTAYTKVASDATYSAGTYYSAPGVVDAEVSSENWASKKASGIYTAGSPTVNGSMARFIASGADATEDSETATSMDTVTSISLDLADKNDTKEVMFGVYVFGGTHTGTGLVADTNAFLDGFSVTVSQETA